MYTKSAVCCIEDKRGNWDSLRRISIYMHIGISTVTVVTTVIRAVSEPKNEIMTFYLDTYVLENREC